MLGSNQKERAVLLCNYFLSHNQEAWVVVGRGIPEGKICVTVLVLKRIGFLTFKGLLATFEGLTNVYYNIKSHNSVTIGDDTTCTTVCKCYAHKHDVSMYFHSHMGIKQF